MSEEPIYFVAKLRKHGISKGVRLDFYAPIKYEVQEALDLKPGDIVQLSIKKIERERRRT